MRETILKNLTDPGILPVIRLNSGEKLPNLLEALLKGGIRAAELTMTMLHAETLLEENRRRFGDQLLLGMGTVTDREKAKASVDAGAQFLVSPFPVFEALEEAHKADIPMIMGAFSPRDTFEADRAGADLIKIFPLNILGMNYLKDLRGPLPQVRFFPTGGITLEQIPELFRLGVVGCGVGGDLVRKDWIETENWTALTERAKAFVAAVPERKK